MEEVKLHIKEAEQKGKLKEKPNITFAKKGNWGEIRVKTWEDLLLTYIPVSIGLDKVLHSETIEDETGEQIDSRIVDALKPYILKDGLNNLTRQKLRKECKQFKSSIDNMILNKTSSKKRRVKNEFKRR